MINDNCLSLISNQRNSISEEKIGAKMFEKKMHFHTRDTEMAALRTDADKRNNHG